MRFLVVLLAVVLLAAAAEAQQPRQLNCVGGNCQPSFQFSQTQYQQFPAVQQNSFAQPASSCSQGQSATPRRGLFKRIRDRRQGRLSGCN